MSAQIVLFLRILAIALLYIFLLGFLYLAWRSIFSTKNSATVDESHKLNLKNLETHAIYASKAKEIYIGRSADADLQVEDESISNLHSRLYWKHMQWWIEDLDSTNGTFLNDQRLVSPEVINENDHIKCGATEFEILISDGDETILK